MRIICPHCETSYAIERTCVKQEAGVQFTIICAVCGKDFDGTIHEQAATPDVVEVIKGAAASYRTVPAVPASALYRWTFGVFGTQEIPAFSEQTHEAVPDQRFEYPGTPASLVVSTRKR